MLIWMQNELCGFKSRIGDFIPFEMVKVLFDLPNKSCSSGMHSSTFAIDFELQGRLPVGMVYLHRL
jgi:hypothetical protein